MDGILENAVDKVFSRVKKREIFTLQIRLFFAIYNNFIFPENKKPACSYTAKYAASTECYHFATPYCLQIFFKKCFQSAAGCLLVLSFDFHSYHVIFFHPKAHNAENPLCVHFFAVFGNGNFAGKFSCFFDKESCRSCVDSQFVLNGVGK